MVVSRGVRCASLRPARGCLWVGRGRDMNRREFITALGGAAATWPLGAQAQQPERIRRIGILAGFAEDHPEGQAQRAALFQGLRESGWIEGKNFRIEAFRWVTDDPERMHA